MKKSTIIGATIALPVLLLLTNVSAISAVNDYSPVDNVWTYNIGTGVCIAISADGNYIAVGDGNYLKLFSENDNTLLWSASTGYVKSVAISDNGDYIAIGVGPTSTSGNVRLFSKDNNTPLWTYAYSDGVRSVAISENGEYIAAGTWDGADVYLYHKDNTLIWKYEGATALIREVAISDNGTVVAVSEDKKVYLFNNENEQPVWTYTAGAKIYSVDISRDNHYIVAGSVDFLYLFEENDNTGPIWTYEHTNDTYRSTHVWDSVSISDDGEYIAGGIGWQEGWVYLFSKDSNTPLWVYDGTGYELRQLSISGNGSYIIMGGWSGRAYYFSRDDNVPVWYYSTDGYRPVSVAISSDGTQAVAVSQRCIYLLQSSSFAYELKTENQTYPLRILTTTPEFSFKIPENVENFQIQVGTSAEDNSMWDDNQAIATENIVYVTYAGSSLSPYATYWWRVKLEDNEGNWGSWSVNKVFELAPPYVFSYHRTITFTENISDNYQVLIKIDNATNMDDNFKDLMFYDSTYPNVGLPYYIENFVAEQSAWVWVKVHDNNSIELYYGNDDVEDGQSGDDAFPELFDNFPENNVNWEKWVRATATTSPSVSNGILTLSDWSGEVIYYQNSTGPNSALRICANIQNSADIQIGWADMTAPSDNPVMVIWGPWGQTDNLNLRTKTSTATTTSTGSWGLLGSYATYDAKRIGADNVELWGFDNLSGTDNLIVSNSTNIPSAYMATYLYAPQVEKVLSVDWILSHQVVAIEPTATIGEEQQSGYPESPNDLRVDNSVSPENVRTLTPEFSFVYADDNGDNMQSFEIEVGTSADDNSMWDNTTVENAENNSVVTITYAGNVLSGHTVYWWRVRVQDNNSLWSGWSSDENFEINRLPTAPALYDNLNMNVIDHSPEIEWTKGVDSDGDVVWTYVYMDSSYPPTTLENYTTDNIENIGENTITLVDGTTYYYRLRSWDNYEWSENYSGIDNFRMNTPPTVTPTISPLEPLVNENLVVAITTSDDEDDAVTVYYQWYENNVIMDGENENILENTSTLAGSRYKCSTIPNDAYENGTEVFTIEVTVAATSSLLIVSSTMTGDRDNANITVTIRYSDDEVLDNVSALLKVSNSWESRIENNNENQLIWTGVELSSNTDNIRFYLDNVEDDRLGTSYVYIEDNNILTENTTANFTIITDEITIGIGDTATFTGSIITNSHYVSLNMEGKITFGAETLDNENYMVDVDENQAWSLGVSPTSSTSYIIKMEGSLYWSKTITVYVTANGGTGGGAFVQPDITFSILFYVYDPTDNLPLNEVFVEASLGAFVLDSGATDENGKVWLEVGEGYWQFDFSKQGFKPYALENVFVSAPKDYTIALYPVPPGVSRQVIAVGLVAAACIVLLVIIFSGLILSKKKFVKKLQKMGM